MADADDAAHADRDSEPRHQQRAAEYGNAEAALAGADARALSRTAAPARAYHRHGIQARAHSALIAPVIARSAATRQSPSRYAPGCAPRNDSLILRPLIDHAPRLPHRSFHRSRRFHHHAR